MRWMYKLGGGTNEVDAQTRWTHTRWTHKQSGQGCSGLIKFDPGQGGRTNEVDAQTRWTHKQSAHTNEVDAQMRWTHKGGGRTKIQTVTSIG